MHTNDTHAHLDDVAKRVTAVEQVRAEKANTLLLDAGDVFSGTLYFNEFQGMASMKFMNLMNYDAMTFGNHEFDLGSSTEGHKGLAEFVEAANFPFVSANVDFSTDEKFTGLFSDRISSDPKNGNIYNGIVKKIDGEKVGIFGLTTEETVDLSSPGPITFENYIEEAEKAVNAFESQGVDKIIALTHIGYDDNPAVDNDLVLAAGVDGIDVIVGGHTHTRLEEPVVVDEDENGAVKDPTVVVQAYQYNNFLGNVDVEFNRKGVVVGQDGELISIANQVADPEAAEMLAEYKSVVEKVSKDPIGATAVHALLNPRLSDEGNDGTSVRNSETPLGNVITDGMLAKAREYNDDVKMAMQNGGGIRTSIDAGPITVGEVITVLPFGNTLATMTLSGAELKEAFEHSVHAFPEENGGFLHVSGAKVRFDSTMSAGDRIVSIAYQDASGNYVDIQDDEMYTVATNAFTAKGGDGYDVFAKAYEEGRVTDLGLSDWENFAEHLANLGTIDPEIEGRIVDIAE
ncbi:bifunctional metallophosphatase/5'-nucleotidase [Virgibacillus phasianinus]|uniref:Bifunctional metallophosphatase/5'-nucleotidase n=2 Tax=Virgibacillus phasianinus TaxID=2017483 RepID=A0A220U8X8_9BACI|nr:bifunctional metallophosphatase/5'-nucleotidase [Virgibacillus phasianinus]